MGATNLERLEAWHYDQTRFHGLVDVKPYAVPRPGCTAEDLAGEMLEIFHAESVPVTPYMLGEGPPSEAEQLAEWLEQHPPCKSCGGQVSASYNETVHKKGCPEYVPGDLVE